MFLLAKAPEVIVSINRDLAKYSLQDYFIGTFNIDPYQAYSAVRGIKLVGLRNDDIAEVPVGAPILDWLNLRVEIGNNILSWNRVDWNKWLKDQGILH